MSTKRGQVTVPPSLPAGRPLYRGYPRILHLRMTKFSESVLVSQFNAGEIAEVGWCQPCNSLATRPVGKGMSVALCSGLFAPLCALEKGENWTAWFPNSRQLCRTAVP